MDRIKDFIREMPKVELHVHLEGSVQPQTLLKLAERYHITLPADDIEGVRRWYTFRDFSHFLKIYMTISGCLRQPEDIELITRDFLVEQGKQNIFYSEVTFTPYNQLRNTGLEFHEQMDAVNRARKWGEEELGVSMAVIVDIPREISPSEGDRVAAWAVERYGNGVIALGLGGPEEDNPPGKFHSAFDRVRAAGMPCILHAGETVGPDSIREAIEVAATRRIGHGIRAADDREMMDDLRERQIPLEMCITSNICLGLVPSPTAHPFQQFSDYGLYVTLNSDDPAMFNTTLADEFLLGQRTWNWSRDTIKQLVLNAVGATLLPEDDKEEMRDAFETQFSSLIKD